MAEADAGDGTEVARLPVPCLVVLVGPSSSGKSTWAAAHFAPDEIVSSDRLRGVLGHGEDDLDATEDAFALLDRIVDLRLGRRLTTVVDTLGLDAERRRLYREQAAARGVPVVAVGFDTPPATCRERNRAQRHPVPAPALNQQLTKWRAVRDALDGEGFDRVLTPTTVHQVPEHLAAAVATHPAVPTDGVRFGLHVSSFGWEDVPGGLQAAAEGAEAAGFDGLWVMDHLRQIPQVGRDWDPMLECYTALAWLAAVTERVTVGALVTPITLRNVGVLAKTIATLDVLSGGRAVCGVGLGWYEREFVAVGAEFAATGDRYAVLEDALHALPRLWGPGSKPFEGRVLTVPDTTCYPRPIQERVPVLVGGGGERRTLGLAAAHADAVNVMGSLDVVRHKVDVLRRHCAELDRDPAEVRVTHLAPTLVGTDGAELRALVGHFRPRGRRADAYAASVNAGTIADQVARVGALVDAGVSEVVVSLPDLDQAEDTGDAGPIERFADVIAAFR
jgi:alkanesulfonate monooxygenase SsuD/methylene tetrahydromethanopterin reductase-like flavin-dependent oxidoreductase (luciferase family)/predicted kinase